MGLTLRHSKNHLTRAVLEGVSFGLKDSLSLMQGLGVNPAKVILSGGGTRSGLWKQMLADIFETKCSLVNASEGAAYGAALLASVGVEQYSSVEAASQKWIEETDVVEIGPDSPKYKAGYEVYQSLYPRLKDSFSALSQS